MESLLQSWLLQRRVGLWVNLTIINISPLMIILITKTGETFLKGSCYRHHHRQISPEIFLQFLQQSLAISKQNFEWQKLLLWNSKQLMRKLPEKFFEGTFLVHPVNLSHHLLQLPQNVMSAPSLTGIYNTFNDLSLQSSSSHPCRACPILCSCRFHVVVLFTDVICLCVGLPVRDKFETGVYKTITEFVADMRLLLENCYRFNGPDHNISRKAQRIETLLEQKLALLSRFVVYVLMRMIGWICWCHILN